ncbi:MULTISPECIES: CIS tube protein [Streptomyces]|uniref:LysM domain-containing protein n=2 Tax=Streptomyces TaxID=1883 RepID=A0A1I6V331_9ACTN|nr:MULTISPECIES: LysM peptidoglycan-binding domain-containing protein [Streptomyces]MCK1817858.1 LysM peptidoglycan-binding domain-containing protein [Streptomyces sp. XM4011]SFT08088.1 LysM domain-containing protein [Streptomyces harbinensis]
MVTGPRGTGASLVRASLAIHEPPKGRSSRPGGLIKEFAFDFNPSQLSLSRSANWTVTPTVAQREGSRPEFMGAEPREMSLEIFLDSSHEPGSNTVLKNVEALLACCGVTPVSNAAKQPLPPCVIFQWGSFSTARFTAYVSSVEASYTLFSTTGTPIRATCQMRLHEIPGRTPGQNPTSGALTARRVHRVIAGDSLPSLAFREYGSANAWRAIAEANGIDNPFALTPGSQLMLPAAEEVRS